jgi:CHAD domain-containing protein
MNWIREAIASETRALERARRRFVREPAEDALHRVRTGARRLRCLLEDVAWLDRRAGLLRRVKRAAELTDTARDAAVQRALLESVLDESERAEAKPLLHALLERERDAVKSAQRSLRRTRFSAKRLKR